MSKVHVKKGDTVYVMSGSSKGHTGKVLEVHTKAGRVTVDGANLVKKHAKARPPKDPEGGIKEMPASIDASNVKKVAVPEGKSGKGSKGKAK